MKIVINRLISILIFLLIIEGSILNCQTPISNETQKISQISEIYKFVIPCKMAGQGTCFITNYIGKPVIMTAKHLLAENTLNGDTVSLKFLKKNDEFTLLRCSVHLDSSNSSLDVVLLQPIEQLGYSVPKNSKIHFGGFKFQVQPGDDITLLGFPGSISKEVYKLSSFGYPLPITKTVKYSAALTISGSIQVLFDGSVSPGMSGSPALYFDNGTQQWGLLAVVQSTVIDYSVSKDNRLQVGFSADFSTGAFPQFNFKLR